MILFNLIGFLHWRSIKTPRINIHQVHSALTCWIAFSFDVYQQLLTCFLCSSKRDTEFLFTQRKQKSAQTHTRDIIAPVRVVHFLNVMWSNLSVQGPVSPVIVLDEDWLQVCAAHLCERMNVITCKIQCTGTLQEFWNGYRTIRIVFILGFFIRNHW